MTGLVLILSQIVLGDAVSMWRAHVIYGRPWRLLVVSVSLGAIEIGKLDTVYVCRSVTDSVRYPALYAFAFVGFLMQEHPANGLPLFVLAYRPVLLVAFVLVGCTQMMTTLLIACKAW